jgi:uncharacterized protein (DUF2252 family)
LADKLCHVLDGETRIVHDPPLIVPVEEGRSGDRSGGHVGRRGQDHQLISADTRTVPPASFGAVPIRHLARKVVGVGSVGTEAWIVLFLAQDDDSPLLLQVKEAQASVLERFTSRTEFSNNGERVVIGQRLMHAASDIFLGWLTFSWNDVERDY